MRNRLFAPLLLSVLIAACGSSATSPSSDADAPSEAGACTGTPPVVCNGCCGSKYAADECLNGAWTCRPTGGTCVACEAGTDGPADAHDAAGDASDDAAACAGASPVICNGCCDSKYAADECLNGVWTCRPTTIACVTCDAGTDGAAACAGTRPDCFGNDLSRCCGNDPSGPAVCVGAMWTCGSVPAPGCTGVTCVPGDS